ncbi:hypothetical protein ACFLRF_00825 [Candidatus Altiarchaeota archaeon]
MVKVEVVQYRWAGKWGPFKIRSECAECGLVKAMMENLLETRFKGEDASFEVKPWLDNWMYCLMRLAYHPPILIVNGGKVYQYQPWNKLPDIEVIGDIIEQELAR